MSLSDLGKTVAKFAPLLGAVLPIPGGAALGVAIANIFGSDDPNDPSIIDKIKNDPNAELKIKEIEARYYVEIERIALEKIKAGNEDRADARKREIATQDKMPGRIATIFIVGYFALAFGVLYAIIDGTFNQSEMQVIVELLKGLSMAIMLILAYYFGAINPQRFNN